MNRKVTKCVTYGGSDGVLLAALVLWDCMCTVVNGKS